MELILLLCFRKLCLWCIALRQSLLHCILCLPEIESVNNAGEATSPGVSQEKPAFSTPSNKEDITTDLVEAPTCKNSNEAQCSASTDGFNVSKRAPHVRSICVAASAGSSVNTNGVRISASECRRSTGADKPAVAYFASFTDDVTSCRIKAEGEVAKYNVCAPCHCHNHAPMAQMSSRVSKLFWSVLVQVVASAILVCVRTRWTTELMWTVGGSVSERLIADFMLSVLGAYCTAFYIQAAMNRRHSVGNGTSKSKKKWVCSSISRDAKKRTPSDCIYSQYVRRVVHGKCTAKGIENRLLKLLKSGHETLPPARMDWTAEDVREAIRLDKTATVLCTYFGFII